VNAQVTGGVGQLTIEIPARMAAQVRLSRGLSGVDIGGRLERQSEGLYQTADWGHNDNSVDLRIELGVGMVTVRDR
jgi:folylpolyglutamate synthase/dihydropteroate synthase